MFREALTASIACLLASSAHAAGGHHSVDDAAILDPGQCLLETWLDHAESSGARLWHVGPACRVGPVELGLNFDAIRNNVGERTGFGGVQAKWARSLTEKISIGAAVGAAWQDHSPHRVGTGIVVPLTWQATEALLIHVNIGRDFLDNAPDADRGGIAAEWSPSAAWSFVAERFRELHTDRWRLGARRSLNTNVSIDLSRAQGLGKAPSSWTAGINWVFDR
ncbi:MAG TPA: hypothetical protein VGP77_16550 [Vicinamibacterales bacterium]|nr:hypothetical protein [Vicinamibacterales bacterium]